MRTYTLFVSIGAHIAFVCAVFVTSAIATGDLPDPRRATSFVLVRAEPPQPPPVAPAKQVQPVQTARSADAAPLEVPNGIQPESRIDVPSSIPLEGVVAFGDGIPGTTLTVEEPAPPPPPAAPLRVGGSIRPPQKIVHVAPVYPQLALISRTTGVVILEAIIAEDGTVTDVRVLRSPPFLDQAATDAVRQWRFTPTLLNGQPVAIVMTVTVAFTLH